VTVLETIQRSVDFLAKKGVESPRLQVELLLAHVLKVPRMRLYLDFERELAEPELTAVRELVRRRGKREPLQHIIGSTCFCGLDMAVDSRVLIPRPETEMLAEFGWQQLKALVGDDGAMALREGTEPQPSQRRSSETPLRQPRALDFGTGSGCIAIALAVNCPAARVVALDVSADALAVARENAARHGVEGRIEFFAGDGFAALPAEARFNVMVANPPYIPAAEIGGLEPEVRDHDPRGALDGGADGLDFYRRLAREAAAYLEADGRILLEFGDGQAEMVRSIFAQQKWIVESVQPDYNRRLRFLTAKRAA
jgi:release factor glutamine methyltransferase